MCHVLIAESAAFYCIINVLKEAFVRTTLMVSSSLKIEEFDIWIKFRNGKLEFCFLGFR